jgi:hypothetical protein
VKVPPQLRRAATGLIAAVGLWNAVATIAALAISVELAIAAWLAATGTDNGSSALREVLVASLLCNFVLTLFWLLAERRARRWHRIMAPPTASWLPNKSGALPIDNGTLETVYTDAIGVAETLGVDAELALERADLSMSVVLFRGYSKAGRKKMRIVCQPGQAAHAFEVQRCEQPPHRLPAAVTPWRQDSTWPELVAKSWLAESPFFGEIAIFPRGSSGTQEGGLWRVTYVRDDGGVLAQPVSYFLDAGELRSGL